MTPRFTVVHNNAWIPFAIAAPKNALKEFSCSMIQRQHTSRDNTQHNRALHHRDSSSSDGEMLTIFFFFYEATADKNIIAHLKKCYTIATSFFWINWFMVARESFYRQSPNALFVWTNFVKSILCVTLHTFICGISEQSGWTQIQYTCNLLPSEMCSHSNIKIKNKYQLLVNLLPYRWFFFK